MLSNLKALTLDRNMLEGSVPSELGVLSLLENLSLEQNTNLNSSIPTELGMLTCEFSFWICYLWGDILLPLLTRMLFGHYQLLQYCGFMTTNFLGPSHLNWAC